MRYSVLILLAIRLIGPMVFCTGAEALTIAWGDLRNIVANRPVEVEVDKATVLKGGLLHQDETGIQVSVESSHPRGMYPKHQSLRVDRRAITRFHVVKDPKRTRGRWIGTVAGHFGGIGLGVAAGGGEQDPRIFLGLVGGMVLGYYTGKSFDKTLLELQFLDSPSSAVTADPNQSRGIPQYLVRNTAEAR